MKKYILLFSMIAFVAGCDAGLDSDIKTERYEKNVVKRNEALKREARQLKILGYYEANLVSKKINPNTKKKIAPALDIVIFKYASKVVIDGREIPLFKLKAAITYTNPDPTKVGFNYPTLLANVIFISSTKEISIVIGQENGGQSTIGENPSNQFFVANGNIIDKGFLMTEIFSNLGEFEPTIFYKTTLTEESTQKLKKSILHSL